MTNVRRSLHDRGENGGDPDVAKREDGGDGEGNRRGNDGTRDGRDRVLKVDPRTGLPIYGNSGEGRLPVPRWPQQSSL